MFWSENEREGIPSECDYEKVEAVGPNHIRKWIKWPLICRVISMKFDDFIWTAMSNDEFDEFYAMF